MPRLDFIPRGLVNPIDCFCGINRACLSQRGRLYRRGAYDDELAGQYSKRGHACVGDQHFDIADLFDQIGDAGGIGEIRRESDGIWCTAGSALAQTGGGRGRCIGARPTCDVHSVAYECGTRGARSAGAMRRQRLTLYEGSLDHIVAGFADVRGDPESARVQQRAGVGEHRGAAADHDAIEARVEGGQTQVAE